MRYILILLLPLLLSSCATLMTGTSQEILIETDPPDAKVYTSGTHYEGRTPLYITIDKTPPSPGRVSVHKEGYIYQNIYFDAKPNWWVLGNILFPWGLAVDFLTGAVFTYYPEKVFIEMQILK